MAGSFLIRVGALFWVGALFLSARGDVVETPRRAPFWQVGPDLVGCQHVMPLSRSDLAVSRHPPQSKIHKCPPAAVPFAVGFHALRRWSPRRWSAPGFLLLKAGAEHRVAAFGGLNWECLHRVAPCGAPVGVSVAIRDVSMQVLAGRSPFGASRFRGRNYGRTCPRKYQRS